MLNLSDQVSCNCYNYISPILYPKVGDISKSKEKEKKPHKLTEKGIVDGFLLFMISVFGLLIVDTLKLNDDRNSRQ